MATRRVFISQTLGIAVLGGSMPSFLAAAADAQPLPALGSSVDPRNVLLVIQMGGGNDGLNTIVPYSDDGYHRVRPAIGIAETAVLRIDDRIGLNPVMAPLDDLFKDGRVAIVQGVGYPNPNRSHFEATQIWETASPENPVSYGWLGRYLDRTVPSSAGLPDPGALFTGVTLGDTVPTAMIAQRVDVPAIGTLNTFGYNGGKDPASKATAGTLYDGARPGQSPYLSLIETTARNAMHGGDLLKAKIASYQAAVTYPTDPFSSQLRLAAQIIGSNVGTRIIFVSIGSFEFEFMGGSMGSVRHACRAARAARPAARLPRERAACVLRGPASARLAGQRARDDVLRVRAPGRAERLERNGPWNRDAALHRRRKS